MGLGGKSQIPSHRSSPVGLIVELHTRFPVPLTHYHTSQRVPLPTLGQGVELGCSVRGPLSGRCGGGGILWRGPGVKLEGDLVQIVYIVYWSNAEH